MIWILAFDFRIESCYSLGFMLSQGSNGLVGLLAAAVLAKGWDDLCGEWRRGR